jgi:hypothetical protein
MLIVRYALIYGALIGVVTGGVISAILAIWGTDHSFASMWFGYLVMLIACMLVFVGTKQYRDVEGGGVIRFWPAFGIGVAIALVGAFAHAVIWEIYMAVSGVDFMSEYIAATRQNLTEAGTPPTEIARQIAEMEAMRPMFDNPLIRFPMVMSEPIPVGLPVALISAALLRNPKFLPAQPVPATERNGGDGEVTA